MKGTYDLFYSIIVHYMYEIIPDFNQLSHIIMSLNPAAVHLQLLMKYDTLHQLYRFYIKYRTPPRSEEP